MDNKEIPQQEEDMFDVSDMITDEKLETQGIWRPFNKSSKLKIARMGNSAYRSMLRRKFKPNAAILEGEDDLAEKVTIEILIQVMAHTILMDVENLKFNGQVITHYTPEIGMKLLAIQDFRNKVKALSEDVQGYLIKQEDFAVKG